MQKIYAFYFIFIRQQKFCGRIMLSAFRCRCPHYSLGFCTITLALLFGPILNFNTMITDTKYRLGLNLGDLASTVFKGIPKGDFSNFKCKFFNFLNFFVEF